MRSRILIVNGSLGGDEGNTAQVLSRAKPLLEDRAELIELTLAKEPSLEKIASELQRADAFVFATGTYWDSWGSPLQLFFERTTDLEAGDTWLGKPAAVIVTMHSVGGKEVLSRLQGVLSTLGAFIPPMSGMAYSLAGHLALQGPENEFQKDIWQLEDLKVIANNLIVATEITTEITKNARKHASKETGEKGKLFTPWPVDSSDPYRRWL